MSSYFFRFKREKENPLGNACLLTLSYSDGILFF